MKISGRHYRTIWLNADVRSVEVIDQSKLPHAFETQTLRSFHDAAEAIKNMIVRGAPLIGVTGAYGLALAVADDPADSAIETAYAELLGSRPTAVNLRWALDRLRDRLLSKPLIQIGCVRALPPSICVGRWTVCAIVSYLRRRQCGARLLIARLRRSP